MKKTFVLQTFLRGGEKIKLKKPFPSTADSWSLVEIMAYCYQEDPTDNEQNDNLRKRRTSMTHTIAHLKMDCMKVQWLIHLKNKLEEGVINTEKFQQLLPKAILYGSEFNQ